ncbi:undecaprenyldiphospho-muramoylpentapeptide beta-N-acetylglucosaminyltransferase [Priestia koreensis]|uniref:UDP-N-acetylglucosamine--N-acetylmuramyl-(pentapeptide) pyrophosphoryl-undecaprenol N-acetylglucosamine transferase n=1 Tax=Priestia koreensis TaxID=284581 RepID=A0A0M0KXJ8_9BACI|nr:undecaprenyldiphospho-muramoylpentapeptide beta-N-acetylglucosaminyltransferase [Priestia koreensis]KOO43540.1 UDP-diphospho-muramoylpentapeptide beta-N-acetylglucosaminyltransferase [Priestia koreensis]MCM3004965.1 undecaprenyldiphospho-muramoylpentapeptide beta-N-acetylglucosaminyltransferase [Priestia koreensis]UNL82965.1 undecaprenyldiphospho-muramoylpentapeptide beta-N-acetylglucosaminyltransferase [Priestia koreensis]
MKKQVVVFTGGGSAGHVTPNIAIMNELDPQKWDIHYIGSRKGIEKELITKINIPYHGISSGKLRRYIDLENVKDVFRVIKGIMDARRVLRKLKPAVVFSKGGFVTVPVIMAAKSLNIPVYLHESDLTPGLANKIAQRFAAKIFTSFEEAAKFFPSTKTEVVGSPIRRQLFEGDALNGRRWLGFDVNRPILTVMGGSLGAKKINSSVREALPELLKEFQVVHLCGKGNLDSSLETVEGYKQLEYVHEELADILAATDFVVTRGGSNAIFEFLSLHKPMLIIPLPKSQSRGDQILNAQAFSKKGYAVVLEEEQLTKETFIEQIDYLESHGTVIQANMREATKTDTIAYLVEQIDRMHKG